MANILARLDSYSQSGDDLNFAMTLTAVGSSPVTATIVVPLSALSLSDVLLDAALREAVAVYMEAEYTVTLDLGERVILLGSTSG